MSKKHDMFHVLKVMYDISQRRSNSRYIILGSLGFCGACSIGFAFAFLFTTLDVFAWLTYGAMDMTIVVGVLEIIWWIREAVKQIREEKRVAS